MALPGSLTSRWMAAFAGLGGTVTGLLHALRTLPTLGTPGTIIPGTAGNGVAAATSIATINTREGADVLLETGGEIYVRVGSATASPAVTLASYHFHLFAGQNRSFHLAKGVTSISVWGVGFAHPYTVTSMNG